MLFGFLTFGMSYSGFVKENVVTPILNKIADSEKKAADELVKAKTGEKKYLNKKSAVTSLPAPGPTVTITNTVAVNGGGNAVPGSQLDFTITVNSTGADATGITFQDILDSNLTFVPGSLKVTPVAVDDSYNCIGNVGIALNTAQGVLSNDVSPDGTALTAVVSTNVTHGTLSLATNGSFTYNPTAGYSGTDSFVYTLTSTNGKTSTATVNIPVSAPIYFVNSSVATNGNGTLAAPFKFVNNVTGTGSNPIFIYSGGVNSGTALTLSDNQKVIGQGATTPLATILLISVPTYSNALPSTGGTNPNFNVINLKSNNNIQGITLSGTNATMNGANVGSLKVRDVTITGGTATALNITSGGVLDCIFTSISTNGATKGISVNKSTGSIQITGNGSTAGSGGTIQNAGTRGAEFIECTNVSLKNMIFTNANTGSPCTTQTSDNSLCNAAIHLKTVTGVNLDNISITGTNNATGININNVSDFVLLNSTLTGCGSENGGNPDVGGIFALNLTGTNSITNTNVNDSFGRGFFVTNTSGTSNLTVTNCQFKNSFNKSNGASNFLFQGNGSSNNTLTLKKNDFSNAKNYGLSLRFDNTSINNIQVGGNTVADGNTIIAAAVSPGSDGMELQANGAAIVNYNVINNIIKSSFNGAFTCNIGHQGNGTLKGRINFNTIEAGGAVSNSNGISVAALGNSKHISEILNNTITQASNYGIVAEANDNGVSGSTARMDATIKNNSISVVNNAYANLGITSVSSYPASTIISAANISGNTTNTVGSLLTGTFNIASYGTTNQIILQGTNSYTSLPNRTTALKNFWDANNSNAGSAFDEDPTGGTILSGTVTPPDNTAASKPAKTTNIVVEETDPIVENQTNTEATSNQTAKSSTAKVTSGETVSFGPFTLPAAKSTIITFSATINAAISLPANTCEVTNKATVSGTNFSTVTSNVTTNSLKPANPTVTVTTENITCLGSTAVTLNATAPSGTTATWYTSETGGTSFATGATATATPTANNTTYWVASETPYCASQRVLVKTVTGTASTTSTQTETACGSYKWSVNGTTYTTSGIYPYTVGCDTKTLDLTITPITASTQTETACGSYKWSVNGSTYTTSGIYPYTVGCDTKTLDLTITPITASTQTETACGSFKWSVNGSTYTTSGVYPYTVGCDTKTLDLTITPITTSTQTETACGSYKWSVNGTTYTTSGIYPNTVGCDTKTLDLTITPITASTQTETACGSYKWSVNGTTYTTSGIYPYTVGCDTKTLDLTITPITASTQTETACGSFKWSVNNITYTSSGIYPYTVGCDTKTLDLTITPITTSTQTETACGSFKWSVNNITYTTSGIYPYTVGCDTKTLDLTINPITTSTQTETACGSYKWSVNNITYTSSGIYPYTVGCHTKTLDLTITPITTSTQTETACGSYKWSVNGSTYTTSGIYPYTVGCDTKTLNLTINPITVSTQTETACGSFKWSVNGSTYTTSGIYPYTVGCDTKTLNLTITPITASTQTETACNSYYWAINGTTYTTSGTYYTTVGCDTKTLNLTVNNSSNINNTVTLNSGLLTSNHSGASYQWYKCPNTLLSNETNQSFTPLEAGDYKVEVSIGDCKVTSDCITISRLGVIDTNKTEFKIYPNPSKGIINVVTANKGNYSIIDQSGKTIKSIHLTEDVINTINLENLSDGMYFIKSTSDNKVKVQKFIIKK